jgi:hypothetical protein
VSSSKSPPLNSPSPILLRTLEATQPPVEEVDYDYADEEENAGNSTYSTLCTVDDPDFKQLNRLTISEVVLCDDKFRPRGIEKNSWVLESTTAACFVVATSNHTKVSGSNSTSTSAQGFFF